MERVAFKVAARLQLALARIRDVPFRHRNPGAFRVHWQPTWLTRWERRLTRRDASEA